jgi:hypothetical protein
MAAAESIREETQNPTPKIFQGDYEVAVEKARATLSGPEFREARAYGQAMTIEQGVAYALQVAGSLAGEAGEETKP